jgi:hypothetical protein
LLGRHGVDRRYRRRARRRVLGSAIVEPLRWYERLRYGHHLQAVRVHEAPIFILGYGRSGTTHLHNLLWQDLRFGVVSNYQATTQPFALSGRGWLERRLATLIPARRPMDNVALTWDSPQEEEIALLNSTEHSPLHFMSFPRALPTLYDRYVCDLGRDAAARTGFTAAYLDVLRKATILSDGKRLVLKTPTNTARIPLLYELFPDARFIHIVRNPHCVYQSMRHMYRTILPSQVLHALNWEDIDAWTISAYQAVMQRYLDDRERIPAGHLFETRFEELEARPLDVLHDVYDTLGLGSFDAALPRVERYLRNLGTFEKNRFDFPADVVKTVHQHWGFALDAFGYDPVAPHPSPRAGMET